MLFLDLWFICFCLIWIGFIWGFCLVVVILCKVLLLKVWFLVIFLWLCCFIVCEFYLLVFFKEFFCVFFKVWLIWVIIGLIIEGIDFFEEEMLVGIILFESIVLLFEYEWFLRLNVLIWLLLLFFIYEIFDLFISMLFFFLYIVEILFLFCEFFVFIVSGEFCWSVGFLEFFNFFLVFLLWMDLIFVVIVIVFIDFFFVFVFSWIDFIFGELEWWLDCNDILDGCFFCFCLMCLYKLDLVVFISIFWWLSFLFVGEIVFFLVLSVFCDEVIGLFKECLLNKEFKFLKFKFCVLWLFILFIMILEGNFLFIVWDDCW